MISVLFAGLAAWLAVPEPPLHRLALPAGEPERPREDGARLSPAKRWAVVLVGAAVTILLVPGSWGIGAGVVVGIIAHVLLMRLRHEPNHRLALAELPDALDFLAVCLAAGATNVAAVEIVQRVSPPTTAGLLAQVSAHLGVGRTPEEAWAGLREHAVWGPAARDLARSARSGTGLVDVLQAHAEDARAAHRDAAMKRARTAGVRSVLPLMVCFLPAFILIGVVPIIGALVQQYLQ